jgi:hypothetical protein
VHRSRCCGEADFGFLNLDFGFWIFELSLLGADARFQAHFANQKPAIINRQSKGVSG